MLLDVRTFDSVRCTYIGVCRYVPLEVHSEHIVNVMYVGVSHSLSFEFVID